VACFSWFLNWKYTAALARYEVAALLPDIAKDRIPQVDELNNLGMFLFHPHRKMDGIVKPQLLTVLLRSWCSKPRSRRYWQRSPGEHGGKSPKLNDIMEVGDSWLGSDPFFRWKCHEICNGGTFQEDHIYIHIRMCICIYIYIYNCVCAVTYLDYV